MKLALLNTSIVTTDGQYSLETISIDDAIRIVEDNLNNLDSAIGHDSTAQIMTKLLNARIKSNRQEFAQEVGQVALIFKLNSRPPEGKILTREEIEEIGYSWKVLTRHS